MHEKNLNKGVFVFQIHFFLEKISWMILCLIHILKWWKLFMYTWELEINTQVLCSDTKKREDQWALVQSNTGESNLTAALSLISAFFRQNNDITSKDWSMKNQATTNLFCALIIWDMHMHVYWNNNFDNFWTGNIHECKTEWHP